MAVPYAQPFTAAISSPSHAQTVNETSIQLSGRWSQPAKIIVSCLYDNVSLAELLVAIDRTPDRPERIACVAYTMWRIVCTVDVRPHVLVQQPTMLWSANSGWRDGEFVCSFTEENRVKCTLEDAPYYDVFELTFSLTNDWGTSPVLTHTFDKTKASK